MTMPPAAYGPLTWPLGPPPGGSPAVERVQFGPAPVLEVQHVPALHPDVLADRREGAGEGIRVGRADRDGVCLRDAPDADGLDDEVAELLALVGRPEQAPVRGVEGEQDVEVAVGLLADGRHGACDPDAGLEDFEPGRVVDVAVPVGRLAGDVDTGRAVGLGVGRGVAREAAVGFAVGDAPAASESVTPGVSDGEAEPMAACPGVLGVAFDPST